jgi:hypothetical protein
MSPRLAASLLLIVAAVACRSAAANVELLTEAETAQCVRMRGFVLLPDLSPAQVLEVRAALASTKSRVVEAALANVVLHRLDGLLPVMRQGVGPPKSYARAFGEICLAALEGGGDPYAALRKALLQDLPGDDLIPMREKLQDFRPVRDLITSVLVLSEVRDLRAGRKEQPDLEGMRLSPADEELLRLSRGDSRRAMEEIVGGIAAASSAARSEHQRIEVLQTYPPGEYLPMVLEALEREPAPGDEATRLLLTALRWRTGSLDASGRARLTAILEALKRGGPQPATSRLVAGLESELAQAAGDVGSGGVRF